MSLPLKLFLLDEEDAFGKAVNAAIPKLNEKKQQEWYQLLQICLRGSAGKPTKKFNTSATVLLKNIGKKSFYKQFENWVQVIQSIEPLYAGWQVYFISKRNTNILKGLVWCLSVLPDAKMYPVLYQLAVKCNQKMPGHGAIATAVSNACLYSLGHVEDINAVRYLVQLRQKIRQSSTLRLIEKYIQQTATDLQISPDAIQDMAIPDYGLEEGQLSYSFNDYLYVVTIEGIGKVKGQWLKPDNSIQKTVPTFVKRDFAPVYNQVKNKVKQIRQSLTAERDRLDRFYIHNRQMAYKHFIKYYVEHGLLSFLTKKLVWTFKKGEKQANLVWQNGKWTSPQLVCPDWIPESDYVSLWHPINSKTDEILEWRNFLEHHRIKQPLKQAYREIYILTDAELNTTTYSNRMAAHILKQLQFSALTRHRHWKYSLLGWFDNGHEGMTSLTLPAFDLQAEYWIHEVNADDASTDGGIWMYISTDQVRFTRNGLVQQLVNVPPIVFSEVMRDIDLFVGVASVGNDPQWRDSGGLPQYQDYWQHYSFGDLSEVAKTRKQILEGLLPKLKIAKIAEIDGRFLRIEGKKRTYKIHIGSTNILMEPNDQYLCIVPDSSKKSSEKTVFLPFEGDTGLSILLSKAFLLAEDDKIKDETILSQIAMNN